MLQRELVERKGPHGGGAGDVRDAGGRPDRLERVRDGDPVLPAAKRQRALDGRDRVRAEREHEHVVGDPCALLGDHLVRGGVDAVEGVAGQSEAAVVGDRRRARRGSA